MPIFEFVCKSCGHVFESLVMGSGKIENVTCEECDSSDVEKKMSTFAAKSGGKTSGVGASCSPFS